MSIQKVPKPEIREPLVFVFCEKYRHLMKEDPALWIQRLAKHLTFFEILHAIQVCEERGE